MTTQKKILQDLVNVLNPCNSVVVIDAKKTKFRGTEVQGVIREDKLSNH
jgi:hypothetical protein